MESQERKWEEGREWREAMGGRSWELPLVPQSNWWSRALARLCVGVAPGALPLFPILAVGARAGHASLLFPGLGLSSEGLLHLQLDLRGAQPTDGQVVSRHVLHCELLLPCGKERDSVQDRKPRPNHLSLLHRLRMSMATNSLESSESQRPNAAGRRLPNIHGLWEITLGYLVLPLGVP